MVVLTGDYLADDGEAQGEVVPLGIRNYSNSATIPTGRRIAINFDKSRESSLIKPCCDAIVARNPPLIPWMTALINHPAFIVSNFVVFNDRVPFDPNCVAAS
jgi:hypothetical protein